MMISFQRIRYRRSHLLLFGPVLEILRTGQDAPFPKHLVNVLREPLVEILAKRDHRCPLLKAVLGVFPLKTGGVLPSRALRSGASVSEDGILASRLFVVFTGIAARSRPIFDPPVGLKSQKTKLQSLKGRVSNI